MTASFLLGNKSTVYTLGQICFSWNRLKFFQLWKRLMLGASFRTLGGAVSLQLRHKWPRSWSICFNNVLKRPFAWCPALFVHLVSAFLQGHRKITNMWESPSCALEVVNDPMVIHSHHFHGDLMSVAPHIYLPYSKESTKSMLLPFWFQEGWGCICHFSLLLSSLFSFLLWISFILSERPFILSENASWCVSI